MPSFGQNHEQGKEAALSALADFLDSATSILTDGVPLAEQLSWAPKEAAARRYLSQSHTQEDEELLSEESAETGEGLDQLSQRILLKATANRRATGKLAGLRRKAESDISSAASRDEAMAVVEGVKGQWVQFISQLGA